MDFLRCIAVVFSDDAKRNKRIADDFIQYLDGFEKEYDLRRTILACEIVRIREGGDTEALKEVENERMLFELVSELSPIVVYPHAVSVAMPIPCVLDKKAEGLSKSYKSATAVFYIGRVGTLDVFNAYFACNGKLVAKCIREHDCESEPEKIQISDLTELCTVFPFDTRAEELQSLWMTLDKMALAKRIGHELSIDIHGEDMMEFLNTRCKITRELKLGNVYSCL